MKILTAAILAASLAFAAPAAFGHEFKVGDLVIDHPWTRATPQGAAVGGGYLTIRNTGNTADTLIGASAEVAGMAMIHEMAVVDGVMKMRHLDAGLPIPAGGKVEFKPGGYHVMFMNLKHPLKQGDTVAGTLQFEHAGTVKVEFTVGGIGQTQSGHDAGQ